MYAQFQRYFTYNENHLFSPPLFIYNTRYFGHSLYDTMIQKSWALGCCSVVKHFLGIKAISSWTTKKRKVAVKTSHLFFRTFQNKD